MVNYIKIAYYIFGSNNIITNLINEQNDIKDVDSFSTKITEHRAEKMRNKNDLNDPLINEDHAVAMSLCTREEYAKIKASTLKINELLKEFFLSLNLKLVDFKIEFGKTADGEILLADEISPDSCRLWDVNTNKKYDKDVFRQDIGDLIETYKAVLARMENK